MLASQTPTTMAATGVMQGMNNLPIGETTGASVVTSPPVPPQASSAATTPTAAAAASGSAATSESKGKESKVGKSESNGNAAAGEEKKKNKRCMFQKEVVKTLKAWLSQNFENPYPTEEEKKTLATHTGLTQLQVNNWFINARRRLVQPLVDKYNKEHPGAAQMSSVQDAQKHRRRRTVNRDPMQSPGKMGKFDMVGPGGVIPMQGMPGNPQAMQGSHMQPGHGPVPVQQAGIAMPHQSSSQSMATMTTFNPQLLSMQPAIFAGQTGGMGMPQTAFWDPAHSYLQPTMSFLPSGATAIDTSISQMIPAYAHGWNTMATNYGPKTSK